LNLKAKPQAEQLCGKVRENAYSSAKKVTRKRLLLRQIRQKRQIRQNAKSRSEMPPRLHSNPGDGNVYSHVMSPWRHHPATLSKSDLAKYFWRYIWRMQ
jgi:hypothetical protein